MPPAEKSLVAPPDQKGKSASRFNPLTKQSPASHAIPKKSRQERSWRCVNNQINEWHGATRFLQGAEGRKEGRVLFSVSISFFLLLSLKTSRWEFEAQQRRYSEEIAKMQTQPTVNLSIFFVLVRCYEVGLSWRPCFFGLIRCSMMAAETCSSSLLTASFCANAPRCSM